MPCSAAGLNSQRRAPVLIHDQRAHLPQRIGDAPHGPPPELIAAVEHAGERLPGHDTGQQADPGARVDAVQRAGWSLQTVQAAPMDRERRRVVLLDGDAERPHAAERRQRIAGGQEVPGVTRAIGQRAQDQRAVGERFIAGHAHHTRQLAPRTNTNGLIPVAHVISRSP